MFAAGVTFGLLVASAALETAETGADSTGTVVVAGDAVAGAVVLDGVVESLLAVATSGAITGEDADVDACQLQPAKPNKQIRPKRRRQY